MSDAELVELQRTLYQSRNPTRRWLHCSRRDWILDALRRVAAEGANARALEVGPGSGLYLPALAALYGEVVATDCETAYLDAARPLLAAHRNLELRIDDITASRLPDASFDLVLCTEVIEHIPDSGAALRNMHRVLKPGGTLVLSTPQRYSVLEQVARIAFLPGIIQLVRLIYGEAVIETGHVNLLTAGALQRQLDAAGFAVVERYKSGLYLPLIAEFGGRAGLALERALEQRIRGSALDALLWTQYCVARRVSGGAP